jgi:peptide/nickel transport system permease protein
MAVIESTMVLEKAVSEVSEFRRLIRVMFGRGVVTAGFAVVVLLIITAIFAPQIAPYDPYEQNLDTTLAQPSGAHLLGTDELGRDLLSRVIYGTRISLLVGVVAVTIAGAIGMALGLLAGYIGGWTNIIIMRFTDALLALPPLVLMLAIAAMLGSGLFNVLVAIAIAMIPTYCRLMCGQVATLKENEYITASLATGASHLRIMLRHLVPNALPPLLVMISINLGGAILMEAMLSFLGIGIVPPTASWGAMSSAGFRFLFSNPLIPLMPGFAISVVVLAFNMVGDGVRDALDPRLRGII